jgi:hypothetical protein
MKTAATFLTPSRGKRDCMAFQEYDGTCNLSSETLLEKGQSMVSQAALLIDEWNPA